MSPLMVVEPVLVTVVPAMTAKLAAVPRPTGASAAPAWLANMTPATRPTAASGTKIREMRAVMGMTSFLLSTWCWETVDLRDPVGRVSPPKARAKVDMRRSTEIGSGEDVDRGAQGQHSGQLRDLGVVHADAAMGCVVAEY